ncbi:hypothetical protein FQR65_LT09565 [Abscondita terminalis]|nr:hypothetical protein FQR65_LT09565 [Abscondita terminalis]
MTNKREPSKCREWEKIRRDKLNSGFTVLSKLLPSHDPSLTWSKVDILQKASQYIEELQVKLKNVLTNEGVNKTKHCEIKTLCARVKKLLLRNEQLSNLLRDAGIKIPSAYGSVKHFRNSFQWGNKITQEQANLLKKEELQKENKRTNRTKKKNSKKSTTVAAKHRKNDSQKNKPLLLSKRPAVISLQLSNVVSLAGPQTLPKVPNPPCFIITNKPLDLSSKLDQNKKGTKASTVVTNSSSLVAPKMATTIKPPSSTAIGKVTTTTLNSLGPGTLILANGNIVPILPPPTVLPAPTLLTNPPILLKPPTNNTTLIVMPTKVCQAQASKPTSTTTNTTTIHPKIRPKINITSTTQVNKVPIPALAAKYSDYGIKKKLPEIKPQNFTKRVKRKATSAIPPTKTAKIPNSSQAQVLLEKKLEKVESSNNGSASKENDKPVDVSSSTLESSKLKEVPSTVAEKAEETNLNKSKTEDAIKTAPPKEDVITSSKETDKNNSTTLNVETKAVEVPQKDKMNNPPELPIKQVEKKEVVPVTTSSDSVITTSNTDLSVNLNHSELSNDIFSTLQVPIGGQNPESTSPTAAFLLAFPLVSSLTGVKVTEVIEEENSDSRHGTPTLLQIGTMDTTKTTQSIHADSLTPNLLNLDNFSFFSGNNFYSSFDNANCPMAEGNKPSSTCAKASEQTPAKPSKIPQTTISTNVNPNPPLYTSEQQIVAKTNVTVSNSFLQQNTSISYTKPIPTSLAVSSTYTHVTMPQINCPSSTQKLTESQYTPASVAQCNAFNPFSDFSKANSYPAFSKPYSNDSLYTNSSYTYSHHNESNFNQNMYYPPKSSKPVNNAYNTSNYSDAAYNVMDNRKRHGSYYNQSKPPTKHNSSKSTKTSNTQPKPPINWMTTPDFRPQPSSTDYLVPSIDYTSNTFYSSNSFASTTHTTYFNTTSSMYPSTEFQNSISENRKTFDSSLPILPTGSSQRTEFEENQFSWSPTKLPQFLETSHTFVSSTLPTLVGDLALGTQPPFTEQKLDQVKTKEPNRRTKGHTIGYDNQSNFLSVSQLVENKTESSAARTTNRRNSGNRTLKSNSQKSKASQKQTENKDIMDSSAIIIDKKQNANYTMQAIGNPSWIGDCSKPTRHTNKNPQSSYSAEALIGHQETSDNSIPKTRYRQQSYPTSNKALPIPTFLSDNIVPYFPPVEISQDNNFMQGNSNYQGFNTSVQNNSYSTAGPTITSNYLQSTSLIPEFQNYAAIIPEPDKIDNKHCSRNDSTKQITTGNENEERSNMHQVHADCSGSTNNFAKKSKHKQTNETNLPGIVDFGFLSMPNAINSPILPDDFHTHSNFLPPPTPSQLYPCKNPLYTKQSSDLLSLPPVPVSRSVPQNFDGTSSTVTGNAGSSLTSFNLSAIFPEINKGSVPLPGLYPDPSRNKNYNFQRNYIGSSVQMFHNKPTTSSSYANSLSTSYTPSN